MVKNVNQIIYSPNPVFRKNIPKSTEIRIKILLELDN